MTSIHEVHGRAGEVIDMDEAESSAREGAGQGQAIQGCTAKSGSQRRPLTRSENGCRTDDHRGQPDGEALAFKLRAAVRLYRPRRHTLVDVPGALGEQSIHCDRAAIQRMSHLGLAGRRPEGASGCGVYSEQGRRRRSRVHQSREVEEGIDPIQRLRKGAVVFEVEQDRRAGGRRRPTIPGTDFPARIEQRVHDGAPDEAASAGDQGSGHRFSTQKRSSATALMSVSKKHRRASAGEHTIGS
jgi:hypothetical protein